MIPGKVSVIIPCFNYARHLEDCVQSVVEQTYPHWEAVIIDDGSTDNTAEVAAMLAARHPGRVTWESTVNQGVSAARNHGIARSNGEFIIALDADDLLCRDSLSRLVTKIQERPEYGFAYGCLSYLDPLPGEPRTWIPGSFCKELLPSENLAPISSLWRRSLFDAGVHYRKEFLYEDWDIWVQIVARGFEGGYVPHFVMRYRTELTGRFSTGRQAYFLGLGQLANNNPSLYPESQFKVIVKNVYVNHPRNLSLPTIALIPRRDSQQFRQLSGEYLSLAKHFVAAGHFVVRLCTAQSVDTDLHGIHPYLLPENDGIDDVAKELGQFGSHLIVLNEWGEKMSRRLKSLKSYPLVVSINQPDSAADFHLSTLPHQSVLLEPISPTHFGTAIICSHASLAARLVDRSKQQFAYAKDIEVAHRKGLTELAECRPLSQFLTRAKLHAGRVSIAIPLRNVQPDRLARCLSSIRATNTTADLELLLTDYGSEIPLLERYRALATEHHATLVEVPTRAIWSRGRALNFALRACTTDDIIFSDVDMIFGPELIAMWRMYRERFGAHAVYLAQCKKLPPLASLPCPWKTEYYDNYSARGRIFETYGQGGFQAFNTEWLRSVTGYNEAYQVWGAEDNDLCFRASVDGAPLIWMHEGHLLHQWHIKAVPTAAQLANHKKLDEVRKSAEAKLDQPRWGQVHAEEEAEFRRLGPLSISDFARETALHEKQILEAAYSAQETIRLLLAWGSNAIIHAQYESALETFEDVQTLDPHNLDAMRGLMFVYIHKQAIQRAGHLAELILEHCPSDAQTKMFLDKIKARTIKWEAELA